MSTTSLARARVDDADVVAFAPDAFAERRDATAASAAASTASPVTTAERASSAPKRGDDFDGHVITSVYVDESGEYWMKLREREFGRVHHRSWRTGERSSERSSSWIAHDVDPDDVNDDDEGVLFISTTTGRRWRKYYEKSHQAYFYVAADDAEVATWDHPDGDLAEVLNAVGLGALVGRGGDGEGVRASSREGEDGIITADERQDTKFTKMCVVNERWLEKHPRAIAVPTRPPDFKGVYGEEDNFWDPEADSHSVDNNEGSEHGDDIHDEAYEAEDALTRFTSAVDLATPEDLRPLAVARAYVNDLMNMVVKLVEEDDNVRLAKAQAAKPKPTLDSQKARYLLEAQKSLKTVAVSKDQTVVAVDVTRPSELESRDAIESERANIRNKRSTARLRFDLDASSPEISDESFRKRLIVPYDDVMKSALTITRVKSGYVERTNTMDDSKGGYHGSRANDSESSDETSDGGSARSALQNHPLRKSLATVASINARHIAATETHPGSADVAPKKRGLFSKLTHSLTRKMTIRSRAQRKADAAAAKEAQKAQAQADWEKKMLVKSGYIAPWELARKAQQHGVEIGVEDNTTP